MERPTAITMPRAAIAVFCALSAPSVLAHDADQPPPSGGEGVASTLATASTTARAQDPGGEAPGPARAREGWTFTVAPYLWMSSLSAKVDAGPISADPKACFTDLLKDLDMGAQMRFEALRDDRWGFYLDGTYLSLSQDAHVKIGRNRLRGVDVDAQFIQAWLDFGAMYRLGKQGRSADLIVGGRYAYIASDVSVGRIVDLDSSQDWVSPLIGGRVTHALSDKWSVVVQGDVGGFGVGDAADLFWGVTATLGYHVNERATLGIGYRYYDMEYRSGQVDAEVQFHGPLVGVALRF